MYQVDVQCQGDLPSCMLISVGNASLVGRKTPVAAYLP